MTIDKNKAKQNKEKSRSLQREKSQFPQLFNKITKPKK